MCDPISATIAVAAVGLNVAGDVMEAKAQNKQAAANKAAALAALRLQDHELSIEEVQQRIAGNQQIDQATQEVAAGQGDVRASAAARGVGGVSIDLLLGDLSAQGSRFKTSVEQNVAAQTAAQERQKDAALAEAQGRIAAVPGANPWAVGLKIGADILNGATPYIGRQNRAKGA